MTAAHSRVRDISALGGPTAAVSVVAGLAGGMALSDAPYPRPGASPEGEASRLVDPRKPIPGAVAEWSRRHIPQPQA